MTPAMTQSSSSAWDATPTVSSSSASSVDATPSSRKGTRWDATPLGPGSATPSGTSLSHLLTPLHGIASTAAAAGLPLTPENVQASDIWSLGLVLYEILTGKQLLKGSKEKIRTTIIQEQIQLDQTSFPIENGHILAPFIRNMLNKDPEKRPTVKLLIYALEGYFLPPRIDAN